MWQNGFKYLGKDTSTTFKLRAKFCFKKTTFVCLNLCKLKLKLELKWNFEFFKIKISDLKIYSVTLDISKNQNRSTGGKAGIMAGIKQA